MRVSMYYCVHVHVYNYNHYNCLSQVIQLEALKCAKVATI